MDTGTVAVNDVAVNFISPNLAFGGIGDSGAGEANFGADGGDSGRFSVCPREGGVSRLA